MLTETVFGLTGIGRTIFESITGRDYIVIQGMALVVAVIYVVVNLVVDISYGFLDPRVRSRMINTPGSEQAADVADAVRPTPLPADMPGTVVDAETSDSDLELTRRSRFPRAGLARLLRQRSAIVGLTILAFLFSIAILADVLKTYDPNVSMLDLGQAGAKARAAPCIHILGCPSTQPEHFFGLDGNVRDVYSRMLFGARVSLAVGFITVIWSILAGLVIGAVSGFFGGRTDGVLMRAMDMLLAFPALLLAIVVVTILGRRPQQRHARRGHRRNTGLCPAHAFVGAIRP